MKWIYAISRDLKIPDFPNFAFFGIKMMFVDKSSILHPKNTKFGKSDVFESLEIT